MLETTFGEALGELGGCRASEMIAVYLTPSSAHIISIHPYLRAMQ